MTCTAARQAMARMGRPMRAGRRALRPGGFTLVWVLAAVAVLGVGMAVAGPQWAQDAQRQREQELLHVGTAYARAIEHFYYSAPPAGRRLPRTVDELLLDPRSPTPVRHLREAYTDPVQAGAQLRTLSGPDGGILGVASTSDRAPLRQAPWTDGHFTIMPGASYSDWRFVADLSHGG